jgi:TolB-like protein/Flp pilus assembly protein TadD
MNFFSELKRRNVYKVAVAYAVVAWLLIQAASIFFPAFDAPPWVMKIFIIVIIFGFPVALIFSWAFEITPEGIKLESEIEPNKSIARRTGRKLVALTTALAVVAAGLFVYQLVRSKSDSVGSPTTGTITNKSIAVLPFDNLSRDPDNAFFAEGIQDEILTRLAKVADLKVIARTSSERFKSAPENLPDIAKQLGVLNILEGSVQKVNDQVRVNVQLINAMTNAHLWAEIYDRKLSDILSVESEIAKTIADTLQARLSGTEVNAMVKRHTENTQAYQFYLKGRFFWNKRDTNDLQKALGYFEQAAKEDPNYALAWSGTADVYALLPLFGGADPADAYPKAKEAANKAIALDPNLAEPHADLGLIASLFDFDFALSMREFEKSIALNPNYATAHHWFGDSVLQCIGDFNRAIAEMKRALELDPLSVVFSVDLGVAYYFDGRYQEGIAQTRKAIDLDPNAYYPYYNLGELLEESGDFPGAISEYKKSVALDADPYPLALLGRAEALNGNREAALKILQQLAVSKRYVADYSSAWFILGSAIRTRRWTGSRNPSPNASPT